MTVRVKASDVLDANAVVRRAFRGRGVGYFRRIGPNRWDDYVFVRDDQGEIDVHPGVRVMLESQGAAVRLRARGRVLRVLWEGALPNERKPTPRQCRDAFVAHYLEAFDEAPGLGAAAFVARNLMR